MQKYNLPTVLVRLLIVIVMLGAILCFARTNVIQVMEVNNGKVQLTRYPLLEDRWDHPRLQLLRKRENLDRVVASGKSQFEKIILLRKWAHSQWKDTGVFYYPPWDAVEILDLARRHANHGFCAQTAIIFLQACLSLGIHASYVDVGHFLTRVWSDEYNHWVIMDPSNDIHYEQAGAPLNGEELSDICQTNYPSGVNKVSSDGSRTAASMADIKAFCRFSIVLNNNQLDEPPYLIVNGKRQKLVAQSDYHNYPLVGRDKINYEASFLLWYPPIMKNFATDRFKSDDPEDFRMVYNQTIIIVATKYPKKGIIKLKLFSEHAPEFESFLGSLDNLEYRPLMRPEVVWQLRPGMNQASIRVKTKPGWLGPVSSIKVLYKPNWLNRDKLTPE